MTKEELYREVARLETVNDQLTAELSHVDELMRLLGFTNGLETIKATAKEIVDKGYNLDKLDI